ncbi:hypothetical protein WG66_002716 [Moniliophthora roreri]|nr:hypothetical protein WG66_002716 [Moniliophthora roreri]
MAHFGKFPLQPPSLHHHYSDTRNSIAQAHFCLTSAEYLLKDSALARTLSSRGVVCVE